MLKKAECDGMYGGVEMGEGDFGTAKLINLDSWVLENELFK